MRLLVDTHVWLWLQVDPERIEAAALGLLRDTENEVFSVCCERVGDRNKARARATAAAGPRCAVRSVANDQHRQRCCTPTRCA